MPGLDASDDYAFYKIAAIPDESLQDFAARTVAVLRQQIAQIEGRVVAAQPEDREMAHALADRSVKRRTECIQRVESGDPWTWWPVIEDHSLYLSGAWAGQGYWQGFIPEPWSRAGLIQRQWEGETIEASVAALKLPVLRERLAIRALGFWWVQVGLRLLNRTLPNHLMVAERIVGGEWWAQNLSGIAWGGGCGQPVSRQEQTLYAMRRQGFSWDLACQFVYGDRWLAKTIASALVAHEKRGFVVGYGTALERQPWPPISIGWAAQTAPAIR